MTYALTRTVLSAALLCLPALAAASDPVPVVDFAKRATIYSPHLSPDGQYISVTMDAGEGNYALVVFRISDMHQPVSMLRLPRYETPAAVHWVSPTRLVVAKGRLFGPLDKPSYTGELLATDFDGKHQDYLYGYQATRYGSRADTRGTDEGFGSFDGMPRPANGHFFMYTQSWSDTGQSQLYDVDAVHNTRRLIGDIGVGNMEFMVGPDGRAHYAYGTNDHYQREVHHWDGKHWETLTVAQVGGSFLPLDVAPGTGRIYAEYAPGGGPVSLVEQNEDGSGRTVLAAAGDLGSVGNVEWDAAFRPFATQPATGLPVTTYIDPTTPAAKLHQALSKAFKGNAVTFVNYSEDGSELLFFVYSDRNPGAYYLIDTHAFKVQKLFDVSPWIDPARMAERRPIRFKTRDGIELEGFLTIPQGVEASHLPMVLLPHGGPFFVRDDWGFDSDAQFLASRGYLVLQVNFRGSDGRGVDFLESGYRQWGTGMQQDMIDGVKWAVAQGYADPQRICVYGGSYGGYSAMMAPIRAPGMFKCAVGYAGIYDLDMMYGKGDVRQSAYGRAYLMRVIGRDQAELDANSPDKLADKLTVPVLLVHGEDDRRAPFAQAKAMRAALESAHKPYEWLAKPDEGHGFYDVKNRVEFYQRLEAFLAKYIGPGAH